MKTEAKVIGGDVESQKLILQANIPFLLLQDRVKFTHMKDDMDDPMNDDDKESQEYYQRRVDRNRIESIKNHIRQSILNQKSGKSVCVLFPTALLLAASKEDSEYAIQCSVDIGSLLPSQDSRFYIVDGQHRMQAMIELYQSLKFRKPSLFDFLDDNSDQDEAYIVDYLEKYVFNCSILLNFDLWEQARIFADINFKQKKVDKSLYYAIYGLMNPTDIEDIQTSAIFISHSIVKYLNVNDKSPLKGLIRMLRNGKGTISQSFMADGLIRNLQSRRGIWYSEHSKILQNVPYFADEAVRFFDIIKSIFPSQWPQVSADKITTNSILTKTTGMGALMRLLVYVHKAIFGNNQFDQPGVRQYLLNNYSVDTTWMLSPLKGHGEELFGINSIYSGTGGKGLEAKLFRRMIEIINEQHPDNIEERVINNTKVKISINRDQEGIFSYHLSHYFQNPEHGEPYRPGGGSLGGSFYQLRYRLDSYLNNVSPQATTHP